MPQKAPAKSSHLPDWANEPLKFVVHPDEALKRGAFSKPRKPWGKVIITGRKSAR
jgi:hypothetical protein